MANRIKMPPRGSAKGPLATRQAMTYLLPGEALGRVYSHDDTGVTVDLAVDPDLTVVVDVGLEPDSGALNGHTVRPFRQFDGYPVPCESEPLREAGSDIVTNPPIRIGERSLSRGAGQQSGSESFVGFAGHESFTNPSDAFYLLPIFGIVQVQCDSSHG